MADAAVAEQPATIPITEATLSFREQAAANAKALVEVPIKPVEQTAAAVPDAQVAEAEADSTKPDAELSEAGRKLRGSRKDQRAEKIRADNDNLARELQRRQELNTLRNELERSAPAPHPAAGGAPAGTTATTVVDPRDPEPTFEAFQAANPNHADPYAGFLRAQGAWDRRQEQRGAFAAHQQQQTAQVQQQAVASYQSRADELRTQHSDYDAVTIPFLEQHAGHPFAPDIARFLASDPDGAKVLYHVAKHPDASTQLFAPGSHPLITLGVLKSTVAGTAPKTKTLPSAPNPPSQTAGGGATALHDDPNARSTKDHLRIRAREDAERRTQGVR